MLFISIFGTPGLIILQYNNLIGFPRIFYSSFQRVFKESLLCCVVQKFRTIYILLYEHMCFSWRSPDLMNVCLRVVMTKMLHVLCNTLLCISKQLGWSGYDTDYGDLRHFIKDNDLKSIKISENHFQSDHFEQCDTLCSPFWNSVLICLRR